MRNMPPSWINAPLQAPHPPFYTQHATARRSACSHAAEPSMRRCSQVTLRAHRSPARVSMQTDAYPGVRALSTTPTDDAPRNVQHATSAGDASRAGAARRGALARAARRVLMPTVGIRTIDFCGRGSLSARCSAHVSWRCCTHVAALVRRSRRAFLVRSWPVVMACPNPSLPCS